MDIENILKQKIAQTVNHLYQSELASSDVEINSTPNSDFGDFATNVAMKLTKTLRKNPIEIANEIAAHLNTESKEYVEKMEVAKPGFINFYIKDAYYKNYLPEILQQGDNFASNDFGKGKNVILEYSSPNIAKPFTIGHLRSTIIGDSLARILKFSGFTVFQDNHLGDWGAAFGKQLASFELYPEELKALDASTDPIKMLVDLYVKFNADCEKDPSLIEKARDWFKKLEDKDPVARQLWQKCVDLTFKELRRIYKELNILPFTENVVEIEGQKLAIGYGESFFEDKMAVVIEELKEKAKEGIIDYHQSEGAWLVFFPNNSLPPLMILKSNGTTLYSTRDLATDKFRKDPKFYGVDKDYGYPNLVVINETGIEQKLYWQQIFKTEELLGWYKPGQRIAITHGLYRFKEGKMSTRKGNVIWLNDVLEEAKKRAKNLSSDKDKDSTNVVENSDINSEKIGIGALKWNDLKRNPEQDIIFDWDEIINLKGNSSPYIQYSYVRAMKVLEKAASEGLQDYKDFKFSEELKLNPEELTLLKTLAKFPNVVLEAAEKYYPSTICLYLYDLAQVFNSFYDKHTILKAEDEEVKNYRLQLTTAAGQVLKTGLNLLGIETVERM